MALNGRERDVRADFRSLALHCTGRGVGSKGTHHSQWIVPHTSHPTAHLVASEDNDLFMAIKELNDPLACHGFLGSQGLLCGQAHLPRGHLTGGNILCTHSFFHRFLALCCTYAPILGTLSPPQTKCN